MNAPSLSTPLPAPSILEERAAALLGSGLTATTVAASLGCSDSYLSQLLSREDFAARVASLRYETLAKHNERDSTYDSLEDSLLQKLTDSLPLMYRPMEILKSIQIVNAAKRRGTSTPEAILEKQQIVSLTMPVQIIQRFTTNIQNQVIQAGSQELLTIQSSSLAARLKDKEIEREKAHERITSSGTPETVGASG